VQRLREEAAAAGRAAAASRRSVVLAGLRYEGGVDNYLNLLDAQRSLLDAELTESDLQRQHRVAVVRLYKALGGGWDPVTDYAGTSHSQGQMTGVTSHESRVARVVALALALVAIVAPAVRAQNPDLMLSQAQRDSILKTYNNIFPILGRKAIERGFDLPSRSASTSSASGSTRTSRSPTSASAPAATRSFPRISSASGPTRQP
jgi:hypothetical protein